MFNSTIINAINLLDSANEQDMTHYFGNNGRRIFILKKAGGMHLNLAVRYLDDPQVLLLERISNKFSQANVIWNMLADKERDHVLQFEYEVSPNKLESFRHTVGNDRIEDITNPIGKYLYVLNEKKPMVIKARCEIELKIELANLYIACLLDHSIPDHKLDRSDLLGLIDTKVVSDASKD